MGPPDELHVDQLHVDVRREPDRVVVRLSGELDLASAPILERALESDDFSGAPTLVLDLDNVEFIDSTGLRILLSAHERATSQSKDFAITRGSAQVQRLLQITRTGEHLRVIDSPDEVFA